MVQIPMIKEQKSTPSHNSIFSPVPKITCIQNFNISEPVIHPPGSDPYKFLNPSPHLNSGFKPMDPMILDPCVVASRFEIVTKTTDLTASEHAGVNLGESTTTIVSTAISESPSHTKVIVQQAENNAVVTTSKNDVVVTKIENDNVVTKTEIVVVVKENESDVEERKTESDIVATKAESKNGKSITCDVCKVTCNSEQVFKRHQEGKIHLKNMLKVPFSSVIKQETSPLVVNNTLDKVPEKNNMLQNEVSANLLFYCSIPPLSSVNQMIQSVAAEQLIEPLCMDQLLNPTSVSATAVHHSNGGTHKGDGELDMCFDRHNSGKQNLKDSEHIVVPSSATPVVSMQTTPIYKHVDNLKSIESNFGGSPVLRCEICKVSCTINDLNKHVSGKKHMKNLNKVPKIPNLSSAVIPPMIKPVAKGEVFDPYEVSSLQCELCGICCNSSDELNKHKLGKKHLKNLKKSEQQTPADKTSLYDPSRNAESKVVISESSKRKVNGSLASEENEDAKKQKMMEEEVESDVSIFACKVCNVVCAGFMALESHLSSKEHATMSLKQVNDA